MFHNALIHQYREKEQILLAENATASEKSAGQNIRNKLLTFLEKSTHYIPDTVLAHFPYDSKNILLYNTLVPKPYYSI